MYFKVFLDQIASFEVLLKVPPSDFIQNISKYLKQGIKVDKLDYFKNAP